MRYNDDPLVDYTWAGLHRKAIVEVLKQNAMHLLSIELASGDQDMKQATDLLIQVKGGAVAVRIRDARCDYRDLTLRSSRASGNETELSKIKKGHADWYLYCWSDGRWGFKDWMLVDLYALRKSGLLNGHLEETQNYDGKTAFVSIPATRLKLNGCIIASTL